MLTNILIQAYDGHMNLILSDVEETVMIVDTESNQTINVGIFNIATVQYTYVSSVSETEMGDAFCERRWCDTGEFRFDYCKCNL